jgi:hypothetical protein
MVFKKRWVKLYLGENNVRSHIDAVHATQPKGDLLTDKIVQEVIKKTGCSGIISLVSRTKADINRNMNEKNKQAVIEYRKTINKILSNLNLIQNNNKLKKPYLHLALHGMHDRKNIDINIATRDGQLCNRQIKKWFIQKLSNASFSIVTDKVFAGDQSLEYLRFGDPDYPQFINYGDNYNIFALEISKNIRFNYLQLLTKALSGIILEFNKIF